jgi:mono/diheme cytochrome c family protein
LILVANLVPAVTACSSPVSQPTTLVVQVIDAPSLYISSCSVCHGPVRLGTAVGPNITPPSLVLRTESDIVLFLGTHQNGPLLTVPERVAIATFLKTTL